MEEIDVLKINGDDDDDDLDLLYQILIQALSAVYFVLCTSSQLGSERERFG